FGPLFDRLGDALKRGDEAAVAGFFDLNRTADEAGLEGATRAPFVQAGGARAEAMAKNPLYRWDRTDVQRVSWTIDRSAVVVVAAHRLKDGGPPLRVRWWLTAGPHGLKIYDLEDIDGGVRLSRFLKV